MINNKIVIFGWPRSGTKLLANVLEQQGYFNFGEFFETLGTEFKDNSSVATRLPRTVQYEILKKINNNPWEEWYKQSLLVAARVKKFQPYISNPVSSVTMFSNTVEMVPEILEVLRPRYFLCTRRKNKLDQLLSRVLTFHHKNYNGEVESEKIIVNLEKFEFFFFQLKKSERVQDYLVSSGRGILVDFDELITGSLDLGFRYEVTSEDQHSNLAELIINYDEVLNKFNQLASI